MPDLVAQASYDYGAGVMTSSVNFNSQTTSYLYDSFWRLVGIVKPGDSTAFPTATFAYTPGDPFRRTLLQLRFHRQPDARAHRRHQPWPIPSPRISALRPGTANTFDTISFTDGAGHKLGTLEENDVAGQWVAKDFKLYSTKGQERRSFLPFVVSSATYQVPPETFANVASFYDLPGRVVRTVNPPETVRAGRASDRNTHRLSAAGDRSL